MAYGFAGSLPEMAKKNPAIPIQLGPEIVTDSGLINPAAWTQGLGWLVAAGVATRTAVASTSGLSMSYAFTAGVRYMTSYTVVAMTAPMFVIQFTGGTTRTGTSRTSAGVYTEILTANTGNNSFRIFAGSNAAAVIDNISIRAIL